MKARRTATTAQFRSLHPSQLDSVESDNINLNAECCFNSFLVVKEAYSCVCYVFLIFKIIRPVLRQNDGGDLREQ